MNKKRKVLIWTVSILVTMIWSGMLSTHLVPGTVRFYLCIRSPFIRSFSLPAGADKVSFSYAERDGHCPPMNGVSYYCRDSVNNATRYAIDALTTVGLHLKSREDVENENHLSFEDVSGNHEVNLVVAESRGLTHVTIIDWDGSVFGD